MDSSPSGSSLSFSGLFHFTKALSRRSCATPRRVRAIVQTGPLQFFTRGGPLLSELHPPYFFLTCLSRIDNCQNESIVYKSLCPHIAEVHFLFASYSMALPGWRSSAACFARWKCHELNGFFDSRHAMIGLKREQAMPKGGEYEKNGFGDRCYFARCFSECSCGGTRQGIWTTVSVPQEPDR